MSEVTRILAAIEKGEVGAADQLWPLVYDELRRLAAQQMAREKPGQTLNATALVHEAYLRLMANQEHPPEFASSRHFFGAAAEAMRRILVDSARRKRRLKRGGGLNRVEFDEVEVALPEPTHDLLALDEALTALAGEDPKKAELVKLRFFAGLSVEDAGQCLGISRATADRYWAYARAWLHNFIRQRE